MYIDSSSPLSVLQKKTHLCFWNKVQKTLTFHWTHFLSAIVVDWNLPVESRTFFWNCAANSRIKHSSMSRPPTRSEVSLSTRSLPRTNSTMLTEKIEWPMEQNLQLMGEPKWVKMSLHTSLDYHYSLWLLGWPHLVVSYLNGIASQLPILKALPVSVEIDHWIMALVNAIQVEPSDQSI